MEYLTDTAWTQSRFAGIALLAVFGHAMWLAGRDGVDRVGVFATLGLTGVSSALLARVFAIALGPDRVAQPWNPLAPGYSSLGALAGGALVVAGLWLLEGRQTGLRLVDVVAPSGLLGLAIVRLGCLAHGCDFGVSTEVGWAVSYPEGTPAWSTHVAEGLVAGEAARSAAVHPLPVYLSVPVFALATCASFVRAAPGVRAAAVAIGYLAVRFVGEFFRAPSTTASFGGLHAAQWACLAGAAIVAAWFVLDVRKAEI